MQAPTYNLVETETKDPKSILEAFTSGECHFSKSDATTSVSRQRDRDFANFIFRSGTFSVKVNNFMLHGSKDLLNVFVPKLIPTLTSPGMVSVFASWSTDMLHCLWILAHFGYAPVQSCGKKIEFSYHDLKNFITLCASVELKIPEHDTDWFLVSLKPLEIVNIVVDSMKIGVKLFSSRIKTHLTNLADHYLFELKDVETYRSLEKRMKAAKLEFSNDSSKRELFCSLLQISKTKSSLRVFRPNQEEFSIVLKVLADPVVKDGIVCLFPSACQALAHDGQMYQSASLNFHQFSQEESSTAFARLMLEGVCHPKVQITGF